MEREERMDVLIIPQGTLCVPIEELMEVLISPQGTLLPVATETVSIEDPLDSEGLGLFVSDGMDAVRTPQDVVV